MRPRRETHLVVACLALLLGAPATAQEQAAKEEEQSRDLVIEHIATHYRFQDDGTGEMVQKARWRVLTEAGRSALTQIAVPYSSQLEDLRFDYLRTLKSDGSHVGADPKQALEVTASIAQTAPTFSDLKYKVLPVPNIDVGDAVEYQSTKTIRAPLKPGDFWAIHYATRGVEVQKEEVVLDTPVGRALTLKADPKQPYTSEEKDGRRIHRWEVRNPRPRKSGDKLPKPLFTASTLSSWEQVGQWYLELQSGRQQVTEEIRALANKLTEGKTDARQKLEALYSYVSQNIHYVAVHLGLGGFQPHAAAEVLRNGYGDCKDKHVLLATLLQAAGMKAFPVLVNTEDGIAEPDVPLPAQFDHVISVVPLDDQQVWLDPTLELAPPGVTLNHVRGKKALILEAGNSRMAEVPEEFPLPEWRRVNMTGKLEAGGKLMLDTRVEIRGWGEIGARRLFRLGNKELISGYTKLTGGIQVEESETEEPTSSDPADLTKPFSFQYRLSKADYVSLGEKESEVDVPNYAFHRFPWKSALRDGKGEKKSESPAKTEEGEEEDVKDIDLDGPFETEETLELEVDPAFKVDLPQSIRAERAFGTYESAYSLENGRIRTRRALKIREWKIPRERIQELASFQKLLDLDLKQQFVLRREGPVDVQTIAGSLDADQLNAAGYQAIQKREYALARDLLEKAVAKEPKHKWAWNNLGRAYLSLGELKKAEASLKRQIEINPYDEYSYTNLASVYQAQGDLNKALEALNKQVEINPLDEWAHPLRAQIYEELGRWEEAARAYEQAFKIQRQRGDLCARWGAALLKAGRRAEAQQRFEEAIQVAPHSGTWNVVARALADEEIDLERAESLARSAVEENVGAVRAFAAAMSPGTYAASLNALGWVLGTLGKVHLRKGNPSKAEGILIAAFDLAPAYDTALDLARLYLERGQARKAIPFYAFASARRIPTKSIPEDLTTSLEKNLGGREALEKKVKSADGSQFIRRPVKVPKKGFTWPTQIPSEKLGETAKVKLRVMVDEEGKVLDPKVLEGDAPYKEAALSDIRSLRLPRLAWPGTKLRTLRLVEFAYTPSGKISVSWNYGAEFIGAAPLSRHTFSVVVPTD